MKYDENSRELIKKIQYNQLSMVELLKCLKNKHIYIVSNAIIMITKLGVYNDEVVNELIPIISYKGYKYEFINKMSLGHLALASIGMMKESEKALKNYKYYYYNLEEEERKKVDKLSEFLRNEIKNS